MRPAREASLLNPLPGRDVSSGRHQAIPSGERVMNKMFCMLVAVAMLGVVGCSEPSPEPTGEAVQQPGQSAMERAMQGMPDNQRQQYENKQK